MNFDDICKLYYILAEKHKLDQQILVVYTFLHLWIPKRPSGVEKNCGQKS